MKMKVHGVTLYKIQNNIFQRGKMYHIPLKTKLDLLHQLNISIIVILAPNRIDEDFDNMDGAIDYYHNPIPDGILHNDIRRKLLALANTVARDIRLYNTSVLSICNAGRNRSALMNALIIRELFHCSGKEALEIVRRERPRAVANEYFERFLLELP